MPLTIKLTEVQNGSMPYPSKFTTNQPPHAISMDGNMRPRMYFELHATAPKGKTLVGVRYSVDNIDIWLGNPDKFVKADFQFGAVQQINNVLIWPNKVDMVTGNKTPGRLFLDLPSDRAVRLTAIAYGNNVEPMAVTAVYFAFKYLA